MSKVAEEHLFREMKEKIKDPSRLFDVLKIGICPPFLLSAGAEERGKRGL